MYMREKESERKRDRLRVRVVYIEESMCVTGRQRTGDQSGPKQQRRHKRPRQTREQNTANIHDQSKDLTSNCRSYRKQLDRGIQPYRLL